MYQLIQWYNWIEQSATPASAWVLERLTQLSSMFAIDLCAYAMSNHFHLVLHVDQARARGWTMKEVVERWMQLFVGPCLIERCEQRYEKLTSFLRHGYAEGLRTNGEHRCHGSDSAPAGDNVFGE